MPENTENKRENKAIPTEFLINSKVIFISNFTEIPEDLDENVLSVQLNYTPAQAYAMMDHRLEELFPEYPEITLDDKKEIVAFLKKNKKLSEITLKEFLHATLIWKSNDSNREKWVLEQLKNS